MFFTSVEVSEEPVRSHCSPGIRAPVILIRPSPTLPGHGPPVDPRGGAGPARQVLETPDPGGALLQLGCRQGVGGGQGEDG